MSDLPFDADDSTPENPVTDPLGDPGDEIARLTAEHRRQLAALDLGIAENPLTADV